MKKEKLTLDEHREMGATLKALRGKLINYIVMIDNALPRQSKQAKAAHKARVALDEMRNAMDDLVANDYFSEIGDEFKNIYYGAERDEKNDLRP